MNSISKLTQLGQSIWYDNIQRKLLESGELRAMIERGDIRGVTSNPTIFNNAIAKSTDYDSALMPLAWAGWDAEKIFWQLAIEDIRAACDEFAPLYEESNGGDGYVSLEVNPYIANDTEKTVAQAEQLSTADQALLLERLRQKFHFPDAAIDAAWREEVERRAEGMDDGSRPATPWSEARKRLGLE